MIEKSPTGQQTGSGFRRDIQGLRALAVLVVIVFHYNAAWLPGGFIGVDVFLVISGYLITGILLRQKESDQFRLGYTLQRFYISRIKRIAPAYYGLLLVVSLVAAILLTAEDYGFFSESLKSAAVFNSSQYFAGFGNYFAPGVHEQPLLHTWSLAVEMQFYLLLPLLVLLFKRETLKWLLPLTLVALLVTAEWRLRVDGAHQSTYYALYARIPEFLAGGLVALFSLGDRWSPKVSNSLWLSGLVLVLGSTFLIHGNMAFPGILSVPPVLGAVLMIAAGRARSAALVSGRVAVWLGALSYSLYLWHWPVLALMRYFTGRQELSPTETAVFIVVTLTGSCLSYYLLERRFHKRGHSSLPSRQYVIGAGLIAAATLWVGIQGFVWANQKMSPTPLRKEQTHYANREEICHGHWVGDCLRGDKKSFHRLLVLGDSHAAMLNHFFDEAGKELGFSARVITGSSCVTIPTYQWEMLAEWAKKPCRLQIERAKKYIKNSDVIVVAAKWSSKERREMILKELDAFLSESHAEIYLMQQVKKWDNDPLRARRWHNLGLPVELSVDKSYLDANRKVMEISQKYGNVHYINTGRLPVFGGSPIYKGELVYFDGHHLNEVGAKIYAKQAKPIFEEIVDSAWSRTKKGPANKADKLDEGSL